MYTYDLWISEDCRKMTRSVSMSYVRQPTRRMALTWYCALPSRSRCTGSALDWAGPVKCKGADILVRMPALSRVITVREHTTRFEIVKSRLLLLDLAQFMNSNLAGAGFGENLFLDHRTIRLMTLIASTMLSATVKRQYHSELPLLHHCLLVFGNICGTAMNYIFFV